MLKVLQRKRIQDPELYSQFMEFVNRVGKVTSFKANKFSQDRLSKSLEEDLVKAFLENAKSITGPIREQGDFQGIDVIADGETYQVKCLSYDYLNLEDVKIRNGVEKPGKVDVCQSKWWLKCFPGSGNTIQIDLFAVEDLKEYLNKLRGLKQKSGVLDGYSFQEYNQSDGSARVYKVFI